MRVKQSITIITIIITCKVAINQIFTSKARILVLIEWQWSEWAQCIWSDLRHLQSPWSPKMRLVAKRGGCLFSAYDSFPSQPPINPPATRLAVEWPIIMHLGMSFPNFKKNLLQMHPTSRAKCQRVDISPPSVVFAPFPPYWSCLPAPAEDQLSVRLQRSSGTAACPDKARLGAATAYNKRARSERGE